MTTPRELLKAVDILEMPAHSKAHLLNPEAMRLSKSLSGATGLNDLGFHLMTVMPGREYAEYHRHIYEEQCFYVLSGHGEAIIEELRYAIDAGDFLGFPKNGVAHTIFNNGSAPLVLLAARVNLEQDVCDYPRQKKRLYMNGAQEAVVDFDAIRREPPLADF
ncbi:cupin domain-containing protein [Undibacterium parvum]|uniref:Cupin domain-containing protein n=2 Tax=Undibacterium TaxID=401469 RepID=A0A6M4A803_9BURK|nr:cupin domain-containing protein [Undibacterium parvum]AZP12427.1 cupin domain-containing protein [Undibacterium parvum]QJQ06687.1 cupin domain-containing protein [Undibacterium piscinae]